MCAQAQAQYDWKIIHSWTRGACSLDDPFEYRLVRCEDSSNPGSPVDEVLCDVESKPPTKRLCAPIAWRPIVPVPLSLPCIPVIPESDIGNLSGIELPSELVQCVFEDQYVLKRDICEQVIGDFNLKVEWSADGSSDTLSICSFSPTDKSCFTYLQDERKILLPLNFCGQEEAALDEVENHHNTFEEDNFSESRKEFTYSATSWGSCSVPCNGGVQTRDVFCVHNSDNGNKVDLSMCQDAGVTPLATSRSCNSASCSLRFYPEDLHNPLKCVDAYNHEQSPVYCESGDFQVLVPTSPINPLVPIPPSISNEQEFEWEIETDWSACSASCNGIGIQTRSVTCLNKKSSLSVSSTICEDLFWQFPTPENNRTCHSEPCFWKAMAVQSEGRYECDVTREIDCFSKNEVESVSADFCLMLGSRPASAIDCPSGYSNFMDTLESSWVVGLWSACDGVCGSEGLQYRTVYCANSSDGTVVPNSFCDNSPTPISQRECREASSCFYSPYLKTCMWNKLNGSIIEVESHRCQNISDDGHVFSQSDQNPYERSCDPFRGSVDGASCVCRDGFFGSTCSLTSSIHIFTPKDQWVYQSGDLLELSFRVKGFIPLIRIYLVSNAPEDANKWPYLWKSISVNQSLSSIEQVYVFNMSLPPFIRPHSLNPFKLLLMHNFEISAYSESFLIGTGEGSPIILTQEECISKDYVHYTRYKSDAFVAWESFSKVEDKQSFFQLFENELKLVFGEDEICVIFETDETILIGEEEAIRMVYTIRSDLRPSFISKNLESMLSEGTSLLKSGLATSRLFNMTLIGSSMDKDEIVDSRTSMSPLIAILLTATIISGVILIGLLVFLSKAIKASTNKGEKLFEEVELGVPMDGFTSLTQDNTLPELNDDDIELALDSKKIVGTPLIPSKKASSLKKRHSTSDAKILEEMESLKSGHPVEDEEDFDSANSHTINLSMEEDNPEILTNRESRSNPDDDNTPSDEKSENTHGASEGKKADNAYKTGDNSSASDKAVLTFQWDAGNGKSIPVAVNRSSLTRGPNSQESMLSSLVYDLPRKQLPSLPQKSPEHHSENSPHGRSRKRESGIVEVLMQTVNRKPRRSRSPMRKAIRKDYSVEVEQLTAEETPHAEKEDVEEEFIEFDEDDQDQEIDDLP